MGSRIAKTSENYRKVSPACSVFQVCFLSKKRVNLDRKSAGRFITLAPLTAPPEWGFLLNKPNNGPTMR